MGDDRKIEFKTVAFFFGLAGSGAGSKGACQKGISSGNGGLISAWRGWLCGKGG